MNRHPLYVIHQATATVGERKYVVTHAVAVWGGYRGAFDALYGEGNMKDRSINDCARLARVAWRDVRCNSYVTDPNEPGAPIVS